MYIKFQISRLSPRPRVTFRNILVFNCKELLVSLPPRKLVNNLFSAV